MLRAWPKKRGKPKDPDIRQQNSDYAAVQRHSTRAHSWDTTAAMSYTEGTIWNWREFIVKAAYGTLTEISLPGGVRLTDFLTMKNEIQAWLDTISMVQGTIIYRGLNEWSALAPGANGQVLTTPGSGSDPLWATPQSAPDAGYQWAPWQGPISSNLTFPCVGYRFTPIHGVHIAAAISLVNPGGTYELGCELWTEVGGALGVRLDATPRVSKTWAAGETAIFKFPVRPAIPDNQAVVLLWTATLAGVAHAASIGRYSITSYGFNMAALQATHINGPAVTGAALAADGAACHVFPIQWSMA